MSTLGAQERPYTVTGSIKLTGVEKKPKIRCKDKKFGTRKAWNAESHLAMKRCKRKVTP